MPYTVSDVSGHVRGDDDALVRMRFEHTMLFLGAQTCEQRHDLNGVRPAHVGGTRAEMMAERLLEVADVAPPEANTRMSRGPWSCVERIANSVHARATAVGMSIASTSGFVMSSPDVPSANPGTCLISAGCLPAAHSRS